MKRFAAAGVFALALSTPLSALASAQRTFVSVEGTDLQPCSVALPCRSFAAAIAQTNAGGEVIALDSGGYGAVTITKSVSIISSPGVYAGISVFAGAGVTIAAGSTDTVTLRGLAINAQGGSRGVSFTAGGKLVIDGCTISGAFAQGISINGPATPLVAVKNTHVAEAGIGIDVDGAGPVLVRLTVSDSVLSHVGTGIHLHTGAEVAVDNSRLIGLAAGNGTGVDVAAGVTQNPIAVHVVGSLIREFGSGVSAVGTAASGRLSIASSDLANNTFAISVDGARVALAKNRIVHSTQTVHAASGGVVDTSGTNYSAFNANAGDAVSAPAGSL